MASTNPNRSVSSAHIEHQTLFKYPPCPQGVNSQENDSVRIMSTPALEWLWLSQCDDWRQGFVSALVGGVTLASMTVHVCVFNIYRLKMKGEVICQQLILYVCPCSTVWVFPGRTEGAMLVCELLERQEAFRFDWPSCRRRVSLKPLMQRNHKEKKKKKKSHWFVFIFIIIFLFDSCLFIDLVHGV